MYNNIYNFSTSDACREIVERTGCSYVAAYTAFKLAINQDFLHPVEGAVDLIQEEMKNAAGTDKDA